jgi:protein TonB
MRDQANTVPILAVGISLIVHLLFLLLVPYRAPRLPESPAQLLIPVRLLEAPPSPFAAAIQQSAPRPTEPAAPAKSDAPERRGVPLIEEAQPIAEILPPRRDLPPAPDRVVSPSTGTAAVTEGASGGQQASAASEQVGVGGPAAAAQPGGGVTAAAAQPGAEIAAYQVILSTLRGRIVESIRYPVFARANGWEGTVILAVWLDAAGGLEQTIVRQSSGYEILDRAAAALLKKVTPIANPLSRPVTIEIPIAYELK